MNLPGAHPPATTPQPDPSRPTDANNTTIPQAWTNSRPPDTTRRKLDVARPAGQRPGQHLATHAQSRALPVHTRTQGTLRTQPRTRTTQEMTTCTAPRGRSHSSSDGISSSSSCSLLALRNSNFKKNKKKNLKKKISTLKKKKRACRRASLRTRPPFPKALSRAPATSSTTSTQYCICLVLLGYTSIVCTRQHVLLQQVRFQQADLCTRP